MSATRPDSAQTLIGPAVQLTPLVQADFPALFEAIGTREVFEGGWGGGVGAFSPDYATWLRLIKTWLPWDSGIVYAVRSASFGMPLIGTTSIGGIDVLNQSAHIGWTAYAPNAWGTGVNAGAKLLLLGALFDGGFERVQFGADVLNVRSRAAIERLGARSEGVLRHVKRRADSSWRDTAVYSILRDEWPELESRLRARQQTAMR